MVKIELKPKLERIFRKFMELRCPSEKEGTSYWCEWLERFESGAPSEYMDDKSIEIYFKILKEGLY